MKFSKSNYQICTRCVMDTTDPEIVFDSEGICNHCTAYFANLPNRIYHGRDSDEKFNFIINQIKVAGKGKPYDCILGMSGGVDSSYTAHLLKQHGLRVLTLHMDNGWDSEISVTNIKSLVTKLGFDYRSAVLDWEETRDLQLAFLKASVPEAETPTDIAIPAVLYRTAAELGVKHIISGGNFVTEAILPRMWHYDQKDTRYLMAIHKRYGLIKLKTFPTFGFLKEFWYKINGIKTIYLLNFVDYHPAEAKALLEENYGWRYYGGKHYESKFTWFVHSYWHYEKFGIDYRRALYATLICSGVMNRDEAVIKLKGKPYDEVTVLTELEYVAKKLRIKTEELNQLVRNPSHWYSDYPNNYRLLSLIYSAYVLLNRRRYASGF